MVGEISRRVGSREASSRANSPRLERVEASPRCLDSWRGEARRFQGMDSARRFQLWVHEASLTCDSLASPRLASCSSLYGRLEFGLLICLTPGNYPNQIISCKITLFPL